MKSFFLLIFLFAAGHGYAQYYYKDIIGTRETSELLRTYRANKVRSVVVNSYDERNVKIDDIMIQQQYNPASFTLTTVTRSRNMDPSILISYSDEAGKVTRVTDSNRIMVNRSVYNYNAAGQLVSIFITSADSAKKSNETEEHIWRYNGDKVSRMFRIKNRVDTTYVEFRMDNNGNVVEEYATRKGRQLEPVYYYYDENNRLTDIVRYNNKAKRLLPEYMFEYSSSNQVIQRITVPASGSDYIIWRYQFDSRGLKTREAIYNKYKELTGKIEYQYSFGS